MTATALIQMAADAGITMTAIAGSLHLKATHPPAPDLLATLTEHKAAIIAELVADDLRITCASCRHYAGMGTCREYLNLGVPTDARWRPDPDRHRNCVRFTAKEMTP